MKQMKSLFIAAALMLGVSQFANAQKVAHINMQELIEKHPDMAKANKMLEDMADRYDKDYRESVNEYQTKLQKYISEEESVSETVNKDRGEELQNMQKSIQEFAANAQKTLQEKELELKKPIADKATEAIKKVGRAKGYDYVLDSTLGAGVILSDGPDLLTDVKKELGI